MRKRRNLSARDVQKIKRRAGKKMSPENERVLKKMKKLLAENPDLTASELADAIKAKVDVIRGLAYRNNIKLKRATAKLVERAVELEREQDIRWAREAFGENYENPKWRRDDEYEREMLERKRPGFYFIGELWARYRDMFAHKQRGLTLTDGEWRPSRARDGVHQGEEIFGAIDEVRYPEPTSVYGYGGDWD